MTTNSEAVLNILASHREARRWTDTAVADDILRQLDLDPVGEAKNAAPVVDPGITEAEVVAHEAAAKEAVDKAKAARAALNAQTDHGPGKLGSLSAGSPNSGEEQKAISEADARAVADKARAAHEAAAAAKPPLPTPAFVPPEPPHVDPVHQGPGMMPPPIAAQPIPQHP
jgi:hypothetical protein